MPDTHVMLAESARPEAHPVPVVTATHPVMIFGGPYSNLEATAALREQASRLRIPPNQIICTGDVVAYCADANKTVELVRKWGIHVVMGNCEEALGRRQADCGCGFAEGTACDQLSVQWYAHAASELTGDQREWMRALPRRIDLVLNGRRLAVIHGSVDSINRFVFASTAWSYKNHQIEISGCDGVITGHSGIPFTQAVDGRLWHNAGAIGMPANDGTRRVWYSILHPTELGIEVRCLPLDYDSDVAARKIRRQGLPDGYAAALETGLWPSCDVLPEVEKASTARPISLDTFLWNGRSTFRPTDRPFRSDVGRKFDDSDVTATGARRATVPLERLSTIWFNTGTLCNLACKNCYIESSPRNDRLVYLSRSEVRRFLDEATGRNPRPSEIGFTGGEPFMNPHFLGMVEDSLSAGYKVLILTNAMKPMQRWKAQLQDLNRCFPGRMTVRVSLDHYQQDRHEEMRGPRAWQPTIDGLRWLGSGGFSVAVAGRNIWGETEVSLRAGFAELFGALGVSIDARDPSQLVIFPEIEANVEVPEISGGCWQTLGKSPSSVMCANSRMVVKRRGAEKPIIVACTLLPYDTQFEMGEYLSDAEKPVRLNHRNCAQFCVLGGASCGRNVA